MKEATDRMAKARAALAKKGRAPRAPEGYTHRTYRTDPKLHARLKQLAKKLGYEGGAGHIITNILIDWVAKETGEVFPKKFDAFYANTKTKD
jgi:citrate synthase